jgi:cytochrome c-type biogenesis protein CcmF
MIVGMATAALLVALGYREPLALLSFATCGFVITSIASTLYRDIVARQRATQEGWLQAAANVAAKSRVRYGAYGVHLGVVLMVMGITGSSVYSTEIQAAVAKGERLEVQGYTLVYKQLLTDDSPLRQRTMAVLDVTRGGRKIATLSPSKEYFWNTEQWVTEVAIRSTLQEDLYVILAGVEQDGLASFRVLVKPLVVWLWIGGAMLLIGGAIAWWPRRSEGRS